MIKDTKFSKPALLDKKKTYPQESSIEEIFVSLSLEEYIPKLKEHQIMESEVFFELTDCKLFEVLEIKKPGVKYRLTKKIKEIKDHHEKSVAAN